MVSAQNDRTRPNKEPVTALILPMVAEVFGFELSRAASRPPDSKIPILTKSKNNRAIHFFRN